MKPFPKIHDLYIGKVVLGTVLLTWSVLLGLDVMLGLINEVSDVGKGSYGFSQAAAYMAYSVPQRAYTLFPTAAVIGALMALGQLASTSELTALRAIGLSRRRISLAVAGALTLLIALMVVNGETAAPWGERQGDVLKASAKSNDTVVARYSGLWAREGEIILNAQGGEQREANGDHWLELHDVRLYEFAPNGQLKSLARVKVAEHRPGAWLLRDVTRHTFQDAAVTQSHVAQERWNSSLDEAALSADIDQPIYLSAKQLNTAIDYRVRNGLDASDFQEHYWGRWFYPINTLALCLAAIPFAFGTLRSGGMGKRLFIGIVFALGFWLLQLQSVRLAGVLKFDYWIAYLAPTAIMLGVSFWLFRKRSG